MFSLANVRCMPFRAATHDGAAARASLLKINCMAALQSFNSSLESICCKYRQQLLMELCARMQFLMEHTVFSLVIIKGSESWLNEDHVVNTGRGGRESRGTEFQCQGNTGWRLTLYHNECSLQPWILKSLSHSLDPGKQFPEWQIQFISPSNIVHTCGINYLHIDGFQIRPSAQAWTPGSNNYKPKLTRFIPLLVPQVPQTQPFTFLQRFLVFFLIYMLLLHCW